METIKIIKTIYPDYSPKNFNDWIQILWGSNYDKLRKKKQLVSWDDNIYIPKIKNEKN